MRTGRDTPDDPPTDTHGALRTDALALRFR